MERKRFDGVAMDEWGREVRRVKGENLLSRVWLETSTRLQGQENVFVPPKTVLSFSCIYIYVICFCAVNMNFELVISLLLRFVVGAQPN